MAATRCRLGKNRQPLSCRGVAPHRSSSSDLKVLNTKPIRPEEKEEEEEEDGDGTEQLQQGTMLPCCPAATDDEDTNRS